MIYMIMRFVDGSEQPIGLNQQLVITCQVSIYLQFIYESPADGYSSYLSTLLRFVERHSVKPISYFPAQVGKIGSLLNLEEGRSIHDLKGCTKYLIAN